MSVELIQIAKSNGAVFFANNSGGKDGMAMTKSLSDNGYKFELVHADLGRVEHHNSIVICRQLAEEFNVPLHIITRTDGIDLLGLWTRRMEKLKAEGTGKPFWSSSTARYCSSDMKREPINKFYRNRKENLIVSCEGIRAEEGDARKYKAPISVRWSITLAYYENLKGIPERRKAIKKLNDSAKAMKASNPLKEKKYSESAVLERECVEICLANYNDKHRLAITWFPIFNFTCEDVWATYGYTQSDVDAAVIYYKQHGTVPAGYKFHEAYAQGNKRVGCVFCIMACDGDLANGAKHYPELFAAMIALEDAGNATFVHKKSLKRFL